MKPAGRWSYLAHSPGLLWEILARGRYDFTYDLMPMHVRRMPLKKRLNLLAAGMNLLYQRSRPWSWPFHLEVELANVCQLRCPVCPTGAGLLERKKTFMDVELFARLMAEAGPYLLGLFLFGWGEPLLHPRIGEVLRIARSHGVITVVSTNGQNLDDERLLAELTRQPPTHLIVAVDGLTEQTHSTYRVGANLARALAGVRRLAEAKRRAGAQLPVLHMRYIAMKHNQHELPRAAEFAAANGFDLLTVRTLSIIDDAESAHRSMIPDSEDLRAYRYDDDGRVRHSDFICQQAFCFPTVLADGTVVACDQDFNARHAYGRLGNGVTFADVWFGRASTGVRRTIRDARDSFSFCRNCPYADRDVKTCSVEAIELKPVR